MGPRGLQSFMVDAKKGHERALQSGRTVNLEEFAGQTLVVDLQNLRHMIDDCIDTDDIPFDLVDGYALREQEGLRQFCEQLRELNISQIWIDDGTLNPCKEVTQLERYWESFRPKFEFNNRILSCVGTETTVDVVNLAGQQGFNGVYQNYLKPALIDHRNDIQIYECGLPPQGHINFMRQLQRDGLILGYERTILEADARIARIVEEGVWTGEDGHEHKVRAVLGKDADFWIFDVPYIFVEEISLNNHESLIIGRFYERETFSSTMLGIGKRSLADKCPENIRNLVFNRIDVNPVVFKRALKDLATIGCNDFFSTDNRTEMITQKIPLIGGPFHQIIVQTLGIQPNTRLKNLMLYSGTFSNYADVAAYLVLCCMRSVVNEDGLGAVLLRTLFNAQNREANIEFYTRRRSLYNLNSHLALDRLAPDNLNGHVYSTLHRQERIRSHFGGIWALPAENRVWKKNYCIFNQFGFAATNLRRQDDNKIELIAAAGHQGNDVENHLLTFQLRVVGIEADADGRYGSVITERNARIEGGVVPLGVDVVDYGGSFLTLDDHKRRRILYGCLYSEDIVDTVNIQGIVSNDHFQLTTEDLHGLLIPISKIELMILALRCLTEISDDDDDRFLDANYRLHGIFRAVARACVWGFFTNTGRERVCEDLGLNIEDRAPYLVEAATHMALIQPEETNDRLKFSGKSMAFFTMAVACIHHCMEMNDILGAPLSLFPPRGQAPQHVFRHMPAPDDTNSPLQLRYVLFFGNQAQGRVLQYVDTVVDTVIDLISRQPTQK